MDQQNPTLAKIPILDTGKFEQWQFRIQQYLQHEHYALWEVIEFGDSYEVPKTNAVTSSASEGAVTQKGRTVTVTADDMQKRKNDAAILKTFGGKEATKKTKKNLLKHQYGNFKAKGSKTLEQMFNRLSDLDTMSLDDLYNHLKVYESKVQKKLETNSQNIAFISSAKHIRGNKEVNTASVSTASTNVPTASANIRIDKYDMEEMDIKWNMALLSMRADRAPRSQDRRRRDSYRQGSKVEEQAPKALMTIDGVGWDWSYMANNEENRALVANEEAPTEFALMAKTSAESEVFDNSLCSKACKKNTKILNSKITQLTNKLSDRENMLYHYKLGLAQVKERLAELRNRELKYCETIRALEFKVESSANCIESLTKDLELLKKEKGYSDVPPPPAQLYSPPKKDLSWTGLPEFKDDTVTDYSRPLPPIESTSDNAQNRNPSVTETKASSSTISPKPFIKFVKANDSPTKSSNFVIKKKTCFNCGDFNHLAYDCSKRVKRGTSRSQNNTHKSFTPRSIVHRPNRPPMRPMRLNMNAARLNRTSFIKPVHSYTKRPYQRTSAVRSQSRALWVPTVSRNFSTVNIKFPTGSTKFSSADMEKKGNATYPTFLIMSHLMEDMCLLVKDDAILLAKELSKLNNVLFNDSKCIMLGRDFKLLDDANVLFRTTRQHNMYSIDLNNIVPYKDLTCLVAKASADECMLWHRRLGHLNFKTMNRLVRHNIVRGLPSKYFEDDHTCTACLKRKQHKASWIKREFSNARTPQQNVVAERRNRTEVV
nr:ribonuclease H-like domain-containing protein [Tanacetum cinerariifolium]